MGPVTRITGSFADYCVLVMQSPKKKLSNHGRFRNSLGHGEYFHVWFPSTLLHC